jgi:hypothetical protein
MTNRTPLVVAKTCFVVMVGLDPGKSSTQAATWNGRTVVSSRP